MPVDTRDLAKQFTASDLECLDDVYRLGQQFIESASSLPFLPKQEFYRAAKRFEQEFANARYRIGKTQPPSSEEGNPHHRISEEGRSNEPDAS